MEDKKLYTIETMFGTVTGTRDQLEKLSFAANAQAVHYGKLMDEEPGKKLWADIWLEYSIASSAIWQDMMNEVRKNELR